MSFDKHYPRRKDRRRQYYGAKAVDPSCRPGGGCGCCHEKQKLLDKIATAEALEETAAVSTEGTCKVCNSVV